jgi:hypothetical protein
MSAFGGKADIAAKLFSKDEGLADRGEYRLAARVALGAYEASASFPKNFRI